jgi:hypothetical protein
MGIRAGFSFGERQTFVGNPTRGPHVRLFGRGRRRESSLPHNALLRGVALRPRLAIQFDR